MVIGVPKEIKNNENRVGITPAGVEALVDEGHKVIIEESAGLGSGISDRRYESAGAVIKDKEEVFTKAEMIIKVKEPLSEDYDLLREGQILYTYLHLAAERELTEVLQKKKVAAVAYETVELEDGSLPLLTPMSEVAGRLAVQKGAHYLEKPKGGRGILAGGVPGVPPAKFVVIGGGIVGINAAKMAVGLGADVTVLDIDPEQMKYVDDVFSGRIKTRMSNKYNIYDEVKKADAVIGAVLIPGAKTPHLVTEAMVKDMKEGSVVVDVAIDQGGCVETAKPTTHDNPVFTKHDVIHYSVANMPGAVPRTSTYALANATLPYALKMANKGFKQALLDNNPLRRGLNVYEGHITCPGVAKAFNLKYQEPEDLLYRSAVSG